MADNVEAGFVNVDGAQQQLNQVVQAAQAAAQAAQAMVDANAANRDAPQTPAPAKLTSDPPNFNKFTGHRQREWRKAYDRWALLNENVSAKKRALALFDKLDSQTRRDIESRIPSLDEQCQERTKQADGTVNEDSGEDKILALIQELYPEDDTYKRYADVRAFRDFFREKHVSVSSFLKEYKTLRLRAQLALDTADQTYEEPEFLQVTDLLMKGISGSTS